MKYNFDSIWNTNGNKVEHFAEWKYKQICFSLWIGYFLDDNHVSKLCLFKNREGHLKIRLQSKKKKKKKCYFSLVSRMKNQIDKLSIFKEKQSKKKYIKYCDVCVIDESTTDLSINSLKKEKETRVCMCVCIWIPTFTGIFRSIWKPIWNVSCQKLRDFFRNLLIVIKWERRRKMRQRSTGRGRKKKRVRERDGVWTVTKTIYPTSDMFLHV